MSTETTKLEKGKRLLEELFGSLDCDTVNVKPVDIDWRGVVDSDGEVLSVAVIPDFGAMSQEQLLAWIGDRDNGKVSELQERLDGLGESETNEIDQLERKALWGPLLTSSGEMPRRLTDDELSRMRGLREEREATREEWELEVQPDATEWAEDSCYTDGVFEPMMSYYYPVDGRWDEEEAREAQTRLEVSAGCGGVVVVQYSEGEYGLGLSGGGSDYSWEVCCAYLTLGFRPPLHYCELPGICGRGSSDLDLAILAGCIGSSEIAARWAMGAGDACRRILEKGEGV